MAKKDDPTVSTAKAESAEGAHAALPVDKADDWAGSREYRDMPDSDKPHPSTVAQIEVRPEDK